MLIRFIFEFDLKSALQIRRHVALDEGFELNDLTAVRKFKSVKTMSVEIASVIATDHLKTGDLNSNCADDGPKISSRFRNVTLTVILILPF